MKRNLFLLFVSILLVLLLKESKSQHQKLEQFHIVNSQTIDFTGTLFIPRTLRVNEEFVKRRFVTLNVAGRNYTYEKKYDDQTYWNISSEAKEVRVRKGSKVTSSVPVKLFIAKDII